MKNIGLPYTGTSSTSFGSHRAEQVERKQEVAKDERADTRAKLLPAGDIISQEIQKEIDEITNINFLNIEQMLTDEHFKAELMARKKTIERLEAVKSRIANLLRDNKS